MKLSELCQELKNWFESDRYFGTFSIVDGTIDLQDKVLVGQYFRIVGSVFNDGIYKYPVYDLKDETFKGAVWSLNIPPEIIGILGEITDWEAKYHENSLSPYSSESFGGYSYSKSFSSGSNGSIKPVTYKNIFGDRLNKWRKI